MKKPSNYYKYFNHYRTLENALIQYNYDMENSPKKVNEIAKDVLNFCNDCFPYIPVEFERIVNFLQGLGLGIPFYYNEIEKLAQKDGILKPKASESERYNVNEKYFRFMAMRLKALAVSEL